MLILKISKKIIFVAFIVVILKKSGITYVVAGDINIHLCKFPLSTSHSDRSQASQQYCEEGKYTEPWRGGSGARTAGFIFLLRLKLYIEF